MPRLGRSPWSEVLQNRWQVQQAFELFWTDLPDNVTDCQLAESWMAWCQIDR
ncbi:hypothetical protein HRE53_29895 (plasmid) [Acaryochloris sp. 'Moss Beach']|uniref:hypothetical protein n=1 Tax=Acaryochloris sp. 'Moss Beach' TaxID=2740837 RepID=UPI001F20FF1B|nr:hypothetical protein [Acaryochloris sp. 'Moss Beach']UJB72898.1 hypothetical protein HRE53_29895 [Acaryochloris sp. 'Moss Beach']